MSKTRFALLLLIVIGSAGVSILVGFLAFRAGSLDGNVWRALLPLLLLGSIALRLLLKARQE